MNAHKKEIEKANELLEEDRKLASEIAEGGDDDDEEMGEF